jgi:L-asparaginase
MSFLLITATVLLYLQYNTAYKIGEKFEEKNKNIFILYTGGNIGMKKTEDGYVPCLGILDEILKDITKNRKDISNYFIHEYDTLLDSSNITPEDWVRIGQDINNVYDDYDSFIIIHGTDTMAYTASALSFMFETLSKTVVVTGSMISSEESRNDGRNNLLKSLLVASNYTIPEVIIVFSSKIMRGCRSTKVDSNFIDSFSSPNYSLLGKAGVKIEINEKSLFSFPIQPRMVLRLINFKKYKVIVIKLFPGIDYEYFSNASRGVDGIVLELYGIVDSHMNKNLLDSIEKIIKSGIIIIGISKYFKRSVSEAGRSLYDIGVVDGMDMTIEAAFSKLYFLLSNITILDYGKNRETIINQLITKNLRGELNEIDVKQL